MKIRREITLNHETLSVVITEHTGTHAEDNYKAIRSEEYHISDLPEHIQKHCMLHGLSQKLSDCTAGKSDEKGYTTDSRFDLVTELYNQLSEGNWKKPSEGGAGKVSISNVMKKAETLGLTDDAIAILKQLGLYKG